MTGETDPLQNTWDAKLRAETKGEADAPPLTTDVTHSEVPHPELVADPPHRSIVGADDVIGGAWPSQTDHDVGRLIHPLLERMELQSHTPLQRDGIIVERKQDDFFQTLFVAQGFKKHGH